MPEVDLLFRDRQRDVLPSARGDPGGTMSTSRAFADYEYMSSDDFEEALADKPRGERWELIGGRVVRSMVGARWEHNYLVQKLSRASGNACVPPARLAVR